MKNKCDPQFCAKNWGCSSGGSSREHPLYPLLYWWQRNTAKSRMDLRATPSCLGSTSSQHPSFYALTTLCPSISRYQRSHTRANKQDGNSNDVSRQLTFTPSNDPFPGFLQLRKTDTFKKSSKMAEGIPPPFPISLQFAIFELFS